MKDTRGFWTQFWDRTSKQESTLPTWAKVLRTVLATVGI